MAQVKPTIRKVLYMRNDTTGETRGKHHTVVNLRRMFEAYERSLCRKNPRPLSWIVRGLGVPDSSFRDFIARTQTCLPSRFGNKRLQHFSLDMRKDASWLPEKGKRKRVNPSERKGRVAKRCPPATPSWICPKPFSAANKPSVSGIGKGTDFSTVSARTIARVEALINAISSTTSLKGLSANEAFSAIA